MTRIRCLIGLLPVAFSVGFPMTLQAAEIENPADLVVPVTLTLPANRVSIPEARPMTIRATMPAGSLCARYFANSTNGIDISSDALKLGLYAVLEGRTVTQIQDRIKQIENEPDRLRKFVRIFDVNGSSLPALQLAYEIRALDVKIEGATVVHLRLGEETQWGSPLSCLSSNQLDQTIAEGLRVMRAVAQALAPAGQATQKPAIPGGIGIQKPQ
ncbi:MAG: hypothetical protein ABI654_01225 [Betaproteobacteria bacterium]